MKIIFRYLPSVFLGAILGGLIVVGTTVFADRTNNSNSILNLPLEDLRAFSEVFERIKTDYVEKVEDKVLLEYAIQGMLNGLDPHSSYLNPQAFKEIQIGTTGQFGGLGIEVGMENGFVKVIAPIDDTPAQRAGIKAGDVIIRLNDQSVKGMTLSDAVKIMRGKPGSPIVLTIIREGESQPLKIKVIRAIIKVKSIKSRSLEKDYGYIRISQFQTHTGKDLLKALKLLKEGNNGNLKGLILDLRNNPGGVLNAAVAVSDAFLRSGLIVYTEGRIRDASFKFRARPDDLLNGAPIVVLVNSGSASASEIVAGALQDHHRAVIMGVKTFGKGSVQTILPMNNNAALKLTTARYFTPSGRSIQAEGIDPDIVLEDEKSKDKLEDLRLKESDLAGHLESGNNTSSNYKKKKQIILPKRDPEKLGSALAKEDYLLYEALTFLKGMKAIKSN
jgi:carboxyl-terminal processing protease